MLIWMNSWMCLGFASNVTRNCSCRHEHKGVMMSSDEEKHNRMALRYKLELTSTLLPRKGYPTSQSTLVWFRVQSSWENTVRIPNKPKKTKKHKLAHKKVKQETVEWHWGAPSSSPLPSRSWCLARSWGWLWCCRRCLCCSWCWSSRPACLYCSWSACCMQNNIIVIIIIRGVRYWLFANIR